MCTRVLEEVKVPKKGDLAQCDNYRGISLLCVPSKILCRVFIDRVKSGVDEMIRQEQEGFRSGRGTSEHTIRAQDASKKAEGILAGSKGRVACGKGVCCLASSLS